MSDLTKFSDGAAILQQVDVSDIFKSLAMGIAEAQQKLDDNSIAQAIKLAETKIDGVSLLQLGFSPVFYAFQYADISASINLQMAMKNELEFGFGLSIELATKKGYSEEDRKFIGEDNYTETQKEYKSTLIVNFRSKDKHATTVEGHSYTINEDLKAKSRVENLKHQILDKQTNVEQIYDEISFKQLTEDKSRGIDVWMDGGYLRVEGGIHYKVNGGAGVFKITDYQVSNSAVDLNGPTAAAGTFNTGANLVASLTAGRTANGGEVYGISKSGDLYVYNLANSVWEPISNKFYFAYNRDEITYNTDLHREGDASGNVTYPSPISGDIVNMNHDHHQLIHSVLRLIQKNDPKAVITITGATDPKGGDNKNNQSLAKRRAEKLRNHIFGLGTPVNVVTAAMTNPTGGSDLNERYAKVTLNADYIVFVGGAVRKAASPTKTAEVPNKFVYAEQSADGNFEKLDVQYGTTSLAYSVDESTKNMETLAQYVKGRIGESTHEKINDSLYFLEDEAIIKFYMMNSNSEDINVEIAEENSSEGTETTNTWMATKTKNQKSLLSDSLNKKNKDSSFALGASVDFRLSRQFEMSMEGNSAMSARLVAAPAPTGFLNFVQNVFGDSTEE